VPSGRGCAANPFGHVCPSWGVKRHTITLASVWDQASAPSRARLPRWTRSRSQCRPCGRTRNARKRALLKRSFPCKAALSRSAILTLFLLPGRSLARPLRSDAKTPPQRGFSDAGGGTRSRELDAQFDARFGSGPLRPYPWVARSRGAATRWWCRSTTTPPTNPVPSRLSAPGSARPPSAAPHPASRRSHA
jgi:hypothetical protein